MCHSRSRNETTSPLTGEVPAERRVGGSRSFLYAVVNGIATAPPHPVRLRRTDRLRKGGGCFSGLLNGIRNLTVTKASSTGVCDSRAESRRAVWRGAIRNRRGSFRRRRGLRGV